MNFAKDYQRILSMAQGMANKFGAGHECSIRHTDKDDLIQVCLIGAWKLLEGLDANPRMVFYAMHFAMLDDHKQRFGRKDRVAKKAFWDGLCVSARLEDKRISKDLDRLQDAEQVAMWRARFSSLEGGAVVVDMLLAGHTTPEIAERLNISKQALNQKTHVMRGIIRRKANDGRRTEQASSIDARIHG